MLRNCKILEVFEKKFARQQSLTIKEKYKITEAMFKEAPELNCFTPQ